MTYIATTALSGNLEAKVLDFNTAGRQLTTEELARVFEEMPDLEAVLRGDELDDDECSTPALDEIDQLLEPYCLQGSVMVRAAIHLLMLDGCIKIVKPPHRPVAEPKAPLVEFSNGSPQPTVEQLARRFENVAELLLECAPADGALELERNTGGRPVKFDQAALLDELRLTVTGGELPSLAKDHMLVTIGGPQIICGERPLESAPKRWTARHLLEFWYFVEQRATQGATQQAIAQELGMSVGNFKRRLAQVRTLLTAACTAKMAQKRAA
jgi:hypothetical protein